MKGLTLTAALEVAVLFASVPWTVQAQQFPPAKCDSAIDYSWAFNSKNQSPCDVASYLGGVCNAGNFEIPALNLSQQYLGPTVATQNPCRCSTAFYSVLSACAACQGRTYLKWSAYNGNCSSVHTGFSEGIPAGTAVPSWAYIDITPSDGFDPTQARAAANGPESTGTPKPSQTNTPSAIASPTQSSSSDSSDSGGSKSNAGAIAGGVVGGIAGLAIVAGLVFWFLRRRRARPRGITDIDAPFAVNTGNLPPTSPDPTRVGSPFSLDTQTAPKPVLYNPADPRTFPDSRGYQTPQPRTPGWQDSTYPVSQHYRSQSYESDINQTSAQSIHSSPGHRRNYSGAAEVQF
ncbi:hypothetical protein V5O48_004104 [Marasmius crinis-equi]|uniref:Uncharacterized protein n=1 Tax=Marasmius crinis-equi TaxID=585013 RepID=A0ABR3FRX1_9AGAR